VKLLLFIFRYRLRRALDRTVGAKNAAVSSLGLKPYTALKANVKILAGMLRHDFFFAKAAFRTDNNRL